MIRSKKLLSLLKYHYLDAFKVRRLTRYKGTSIIMGVWLALFMLSIIFYGAMNFTETFDGNKEIYEGTNLYLLSLAANFITNALIVIVLGTCDIIINMFIGGGNDSIKAMPLNKKELYEYNNLKGLGLPFAAYTLLSLGILIGQIVYGYWMPQYFLLWCILYISAFILALVITYIIAFFTSFMAIKFDNYRKAFIMFLVLDSEIILLLFLLLDLFNLGDIFTKIMGIVFLPLSMCVIAPNWFIALILSLVGLCITYVLYKLVVVCCYKVFLEASEAAVKPVLVKVKGEYNFTKKSFKRSLLIKEYKCFKANYISTLIMLLVYLFFILLGCSLFDIEYSEYGQMIFDYIAILGSCVFLTMGVCTTTFFAIEFKQMWIVKTWPITFKDFIQSKIDINSIIITIVAIILLVGLFFTKIISLDLCIVLIVIHALLAYFNSSLGVWLGMKYNSNIGSIAINCFAAIEGLVLATVFAVAGYWIGGLICSILIIIGILCLNHKYNDSKTYDAFIKKQID